VTHGLTERIGSMKEIHKMMWVVVNKEGTNPQLETISELKRNCISKFIDGSGFTWDRCKSLGWKTTKVLTNIKEA